MAKTNKPLGYVYYSSVGLELVVATLVGVGMGWVIDKYVFNNRFYPWITVVFLFFGFAAGIKNVLAIAKKLENDDAGNNK